MYLRRVRSKEAEHYVIRRSVRVNGCWKYQDLADLGPDPERFIEYTGGDGFYFDPDLEENLRACGVDYSSEDLERLFFPFLKPHIRRIIESFQTRRSRQRPWGRYSDLDLHELQGELHPFDKRRMHFLRCGRVDIGNLEGRPWKFLNVLVEKSRDEIENTIEGMEPILRPHEMRSYLFTSLELQRCFPHHLLRKHPIALDQEKVDECFVDALCQLNNDGKFFSGVDCRDAGTLHPYLSRYLVLYFDSSFAAAGWPEHFEEFIRGRVRGRLPPSRGMDVDSACRALEINKEDLAKLHRKDLVRMYRKKAKELHPDKGGDKESFIQMTRAFECLLERK